MIGKTPSQRKHERLIKRRAAMDLKNPKKPEFKEGEIVYCKHELDSSLIFGETYTIGTITKNITSVYSYWVIGKLSNGHEEGGNFAEYRFTNSKDIIEKIKKYRIQKRFDL